MKPGGLTIMLIQIEYEFNATAQQLWDIVGTPNRIDWVPGVTECVFDGKVRRLGMPGAGQIAEKILLHSKRKANSYLPALKGADCLLTAHGVADHTRTR